MADPVKPQLDVMVIAHNHIDLTIRCVKAIYDYTTTPFHLIVVDDSTDLTPRYFEQFLKEHDNLTYLHADKTYPNSYEVINAGLEHCQTPYVALCVNSLTVEPEWEIAGLQLMRTNPQIGLVGFKQLFQRNGLIESAGMMSTFGKAMLSDIGQGQASHRLTKAYKCEAVAWAFVLLRKEAVKGMLGDCPYHGWKGWEDHEACFRAREKGWEIWYCGLGVGYHQAFATRGSIDPKDSRLNLENREIFAKRWGYWETYHKASQIEEYFPHVRPREKKMAMATVAGVTRDFDSFRKAGLVNV